MKAQEEATTLREEATALRVQNQQLLANHTVLEQKMGNVEAQLAILMASHNNPQAPVQTPLQPHHSHSVHGENNFPGSSLLAEDGTSAPSAGHDISPFHHSAI